MQGDYYGGPNPLIKGTLSSIERERLREKEKEARAQMTFEAEQRETPDINTPLFGELVRVNPRVDDKDSLQIQKKLGKFDNVKHLLADQGVGNLFGIDGHPPPSPAPCPPVHSSSSSRSSGISAPTPEFKKPTSAPPTSSRSHHHHHHQSSSSSQRGSFVKPSEGKQTHNGRGSYQGQTVKHSSSSYRSSSSSSASSTKGPATSSSSSTYSSSRLHQSARSLPKLNTENRDGNNSSYFSNGTTQDRPQANVENILDEMTMLRTPLTGIAATPRKEMESKFTFDRNLEKIVSLSNNKKPYEKVGTKDNAISRILGPPPRIKKNLCSPVYKSSGESPIPISKTPGHNTTPVPSPSNKTIVTNQPVSSFSTTAIEQSSTLPKSSPRLLLPTSSYLKDLSLSEDSSSCESGSEDTPRPPPPTKSVVKSQTPIATPPSSNSCTNSRANVTSAREMSPKKETVLSSSSEDSDSESDSEGSSSDSTPSASPSPSPSTSSVTRPSTTTVNTTPETENQHRWNLNTILRKLEKPPTPEAAPTQVQQTNQGTDNNNEVKSADDSDSCSSDSSHKSDSSSDSSSSDSESDAEEEVSKSAVTEKVETKEPPSATTMTVVDDESTRNSTTEVSKSPFVNGSKSATTAATSAIIGVVKPHQRRPPSPELNWRADMDYGVSRRLPNEDYGRSMLTDGNIHSSSNVLRLQEQKRQMLGLLPNMTAPPMRQVHRNIGSSQRNMLSSTTQMLEPPPQQKRRGRKRLVRPPSSESESENPPVVTPRPERRRGRPPTKRPAAAATTAVRNPPISRLVSQNTNPIVEKYRTTNLWDAELANGYPSNLDGLDSDSEDDSAIIPPKPTARVVPAMNRRDYRADLYSINNRSSNNFRVPTPGSRTRNEEVFNPLSRNITGRGSDNYMPLSGSSSARNEYNSYSISVPGSSRNRDFNDSSSLCGNNNIDDSPPKLDVEGIAVQDKKKSDTLRKLFSRREEGGGKGGGKGKGGKGKCGVIVVDGEQDRRLSDRSHSPIVTQERTSSSSSSSSSSNLVLPSLSYNSEGKPSLKCTIQLSKISLPLPAIKDAKEQTTKVPDECKATNIVPPAVTFSSTSLVIAESRHDKKREHRSSSRKKKSKKSKRRSSISPLKVVPQTPQTERRDTSQIMLTDNDQSTVRYNINVLTCYDASTGNGRLKNNASINDDECREVVVDNNDNRNNHTSTSYRTNNSNNNTSNNCYNRTSNDYHSNSSSYQHRHINSSDTRRKINRISSNSLVGTREGKMQDPLTDEDDLMDGTSGRSVEPDTSSYDEGETTTTTTSRGTVANNNNGNSVGVYSNVSPDGENYGLVVGADDTFDQRQPMVVHSYYSYLEQRRLAQERNVEAANVSPNVYLLQAKRLKHAADEMEEDQIAQGMQYLEAILSFLLTGHALEARSQLDTAHSMFSETLKLIVYISRKFRSISSLALEPSIPIKIAILSLRCESLLNVKLFSMNVGDAMETYQKVSEYVNMAACTYEAEDAGVVTQCSPHSPSPSPASSSGYSSSSSDRHNVFLPLDIFTALKKQATFHKILLDAFDYWKESDNLIYKHQTEGFFIELDRHCGQLTLHSSLIDLVDYVRDGIQRLKQLIASNNVPTVNR